MSRSTGRAAPVRWRADVGWEMRCPSCEVAGKGQRFWPLSDEFWDKRRMTRCLACTATEKRLRERKRRQVSPEAREKNKERCRLAWLAVKSDPVLLSIYREKSRESSKRYRDRQRERAA